MTLKTTPATGILLSPEAQRKLSAQTVARLADLQGAKALPADEMKSLTASLPGKAAGKEASRTDLEKWLLEALAPTEPCYFGDRVYYLPTEADIAGAWAGSGLSGLINVPQRFDCDDFAFAFKGHCSSYAYVRGNWGFAGVGLGFVSGEFDWATGRHAANLFVDFTSGAPEVKFIEPSDGKVYPLHQHRKIYRYFV